MPSPERSIIREVWAENLDQEMALLRELVDHYPYLAMVCP
jgi:CCR4-NOT transcription complex subunit 7/8